VARGGDARSPMDVSADVALVGEQRRPRVHACPHADRAGAAERRAERSCCGERPRRSREGEEESVPLRVHLGAAVGAARLPNDTSMLSERFCVRLGAKLVQ
jgi:hypothetical protein